MGPLISVLINKMKEEKSLYEQLFTYEQEKREVLINSDVVRLNELVALEGSILKKIKKANAEVAKALHDIAKKKGLEARPNIADILNIVGDDADAQKLQDVQGEYKALITKLNGITELNLKLATSQSQYNMLSLEILTGTGGIGDTYSESGLINEENVQRRGLIDQEV